MYREMQALEVGGCGSRAKARNTAGSIFLLDHTPMCECLKLISLQRSLLYKISPLDAIPSFLYFIPNSNQHTTL